MLLYTGASSYAAKVDNLMWFIVITSAIILAGITSFTVYCLIRYNKNRHPVAADISGNLFLEATWTIIPTILVMIMFYYGWRDFSFMRGVPKDAMEIKVEGKQWSWLFMYDNKKKSSMLRVPVNKPVKLLLSSRDVIHSLYIPAFRIKEDAVPGMNNYLWFSAIDKGTYDILCAEYCGDLHSVMRSTVEVMDMDKFTVWYNTPPTQLEIGEELVKTCTSCHTFDGSPKVGPTFKGIWGRPSTVVTNGQERTVTVDAAYIKKSLQEPQADVVKGFLPAMLPQALTDSEITAVTEYLKTIK